MGKANFTEDFKRDAVLQVTERGYPVAEVAARLGISKYSLYEWKKRYAKPAAAAHDDDQAAEVRRLKRELQRVTEERDILKSNGVLRARVPVKYVFIRAHRAEFGVRAMCRVLRVHFSGFYAWLKEPLSLRARGTMRDRPH